MKTRTDKIGELTGGDLIPYDDLSKRSKRKIKRANNQIDRFNNRLTEYRGDLGNFKNRLLKLYNKKIFESIYRDKKNINNNVNLILLKSLGNAFLKPNINLDKIKKLIKN